MKQHEKTELSNELFLKELYNPKNIEGILVWRKGKSIEIGKADNQGFQEYPKSIELWEKLEDGRLMRVQRWLKKSITHVVINNKFEAI